MDSKQLRPEQLIAAGGSGQEVAAAALRLSYLGGLEIPDVVIIDSDVAPDPGSLTTRSQELQELNNTFRVTHVVADDRVIFLNPTSLPQAQNAVRTIGEFFATAGHPDEATKDLLNLLLDKGQQATTIDNGFHGQPALGSIIFSASAASAQGPFEQYVDRLQATAQARSGVRVVLAGSLSGGMGTAVMPVVVRELARIKQGLAADRNRVQVGALLFWPWFRLAKMDNITGSEEPDVTQAQLDRNALSLLRGYLENSLTNDIDAFLLLSLPRPVDRTSHGGQRQPETRHYLNVCAGIQALNMLNAERAQTAFGTAPQDPKGLFEMFLSDGEAAFDGPPAGPALVLDAQSTCDVRRFINVARSLEAFTRALCFELSVDEPVATHHGAIAARLKLLKTQDQRQAFVATVKKLHGLHTKCRLWLEESLQSLVGANRADTMRAFETEGLPRLFDTSYGSVLRTLGALTAVMPTSRGLITKLGPFVELGADGGAEENPGIDGAKSAWALVKQARQHILSRR